MAIRCYAQRLLNPFRGAMNIIEQDGAEAVTVDGRHWDIYVRDLSLVQDLAAPGPVQTSEIRFGSWSERDGLKRGAIHPSEDFRALEARGARLFEYLLAHHRDIPFPFADRFELWLLDAEHRPLGLLHSVVDPRDIEPDYPLAWRAGHECERKFRPHTGADAMAETPGARLARIVNAGAGAAPRAQWFERDADGSGRGLDGNNLGSALLGRGLPAAAFPAWFVRTPAGSGAGDRELLERFFDWQAPWLLLLQNLAPATRRRLEPMAARRALAVEKNHRLYPDVIDPDLIRRARVEAALRGSAADVPDDDTAVATFYVELNISRTN